MSKYVNVYHTHKGGGEIALYFYFILFLPCGSKKEKENIHTYIHINRIFSNNMSIFKKYTAHQANRGYLKAKKGVGSVRFDVRAEENR